MLPSASSAVSAYLTWPQAGMGGIVPSFQDAGVHTYFDGWWVVFENLHHSHHTEGQVPRGREQQWGREAADGNQYLNLVGEQIQGGRVNYSHWGGRGPH